MFLIKLPWKIFCYFLDGVLRVALLALLLFLLAQHTDSVLANVQDFTNGAAKKIKATQMAKATSSVGNPLDKLKSSIKELSTLKTAFATDEEAHEKRKNVKGDSSKSWFQAKIY